MATVLLCAQCAGFITETPYYGHCDFIPYCCQQHARDDERRHNCEELKTMMGDLLVHFENLGNVHPSLIGRAFAGHLPDMIALLQFVQGDYINDIKKFLLVLFPLLDQTNLRIFFKGEPCMLHATLLNYYREQYEI